MNKTNHAAALRRAKLAVKHAKEIIRVAGEDGEIEVNDARAYLDAIADKKAAKRSREKVAAERNALRAQLADAMDALSTPCEYPGECHACGGVIDFGCRPITGHHPSCFLAPLIASK